MVAVRVATDERDDLSDTLELYMDQVGFAVNDDGEMEETVTSIPYVQCTESHFNIPTSLFSTYELYDYLCPNSSDLKLSGNLHSDGGYSISLTLSDCTSHSSCEDPSDIHCIINSINFDIVIKNQYFDFKDIDHPIKSCIDNTYTHQLNDDYISIFESSEGNSNHNKSQTENPEIMDNDNSDFTGNEELNGFNESIEGSNKPLVYDAKNDQTAINQAKPFKLPNT